jgi:hypothetical protein
VKSSAQLRAPEPEQTTATPARDASTLSGLVRVDDAYLPLTALRDYAGLSVRTLRGYLTHPLHPLPCYRIGGKVLVRRSDFDQWARQFRAVASSAVESLVTEALRGL